MVALITFAGKTFGQKLIAAEDVEELISVIFNAKAQRRKEDNLKLKNSRLEFTVLIFKDYSDKL
jgi:hypothetical protein